VHKYQDNMYFSCCSLYTVNRHDSTFVTITSEVNGKAEILTHVDHLKPIK